MPVSPSVHSRIRSPGTTSMSPSSTWIVWSTPRARVRMLRCGWVSASSGVISPSITMRWTSVWSSVICASSPPRRRYARESPTCTRCTRLPSTWAAVSVVPMPETLAVVLRAVEHRAVGLGDLFGERALPALEHPLDGLEREARCDLAAAVPTHPVRDRVQGFERPGTSPRCPRGPGRCPSWRPRAPSSLELQDGLADLQDVAGVDLDRGVDATVVEQRPVRRPLILDVPGAVLAVQACVHL